MPSHRLSLWGAALGLVVAIAVGVFARFQYDRLVATMPIVVPAQPIPPYTVITADQLTWRELPQVLQQEAIYLTPEDLVGKLTTVALRPGQLVYRDQAVPPDTFRLTPEPQLTVVSFPVRLDHAAGGRVQRGQRVDIYRLTQPSPGPVVQCLATDVPVVDVLNSPGALLGDSRPASLASGAGGTLESPVILTVAVSPTLAVQLMQWVGAEERGDGQLWIGLSPLLRQPEPPAPPAAIPAPPVATVITPTRVATPAPPPIPNRAVANGPTRMGVCANLLLAPADRQRTLDRAADLSVTWIAQPVTWRDFEGQPGTIHWAGLDDAIHAAHGRGFQLLLSVTKAPAWARQDGRINPTAYGDFVVALVSRYRGQVQAIEVYNEPNLAAEWGGPCNAQAYTALLKEAYQRIKAVDPAIVVVSAGLAPTGVNDGYTAIDDVVFLRQVQAAGGLGYCDAVGAHAHGFNNPPNAPVNSRCTENPRFGCHASFYLLRYRELQAVAGAKPLWVTECGYASTREPQPGYEYAQDNPEGALPDYLAETLKLLRGDGAGAVFWWNLNYGPTGGEQAAFSLLDRQWNPRPHYHRLRSELAQGG